MEMADSLSESSSSHNESIWSIISSDKCGAGGSDSEGAPEAPAESEDPAEASAVVIDVAPPS